MHRIPLTDDRMVSRAHGMIEQCANTPKLHEVVVGPAGRRDRVQNARYWARVNEICNFTGQDPYEVHLWFKSSFIGLNLVPGYGGDIWQPFSSKQLTSPEFDVFLSRLESFAARSLDLPLTQDGSFLLK